MIGRMIGPSSALLTQPQMYTSNKEVRPRWRNFWAVLSPALGHPGQVTTHLSRSPSPAERGWTRVTPHVCDALPHPVLVEAGGKRSLPLEEAVAVALIPGLRCLTCHWGLAATPAGDLREPVSEGGVARPRQPCRALLMWFQAALRKSLPPNDWPHASPRASQDPAIVGAEAKGPDRPSPPLGALLAEGPREEGCLRKVRGEESESWTSDELAPPSQGSAKDPSACPGVQGWPCEGPSPGSRHWGWALCGGRKDRCNSVKVMCSVSIEGRRRDAGPALPNTRW